METEDETKSCMTEVVDEDETKSCMTELVDDESKSQVEEVVELKEEDSDAPEPCAYCLEAGADPYRRCNCWVIDS